MICDDHEHVLGGALSGKEPPKIVPERQEGHLSSPQSVPCYSKTPLNSSLGLILTQDLSSSLFGNPLEVVR
jgi:hypothetical protein